MKRTVESSIQALVLEQTEILMEHGYPQSYIAGEAQVDAGSFSRYLNGKLGMRFFPPLLEKLMDYFGIEIIVRLKNT